MIITTAKNDTGVNDPKMEVVTILNDVEKQVTVTEADLNVNIENNSEKPKNVKWSRYLHQAIICLLLMLLLWTNFAQHVAEKPKVSFSIHGAELDLNEPQYLLPYRLRFNLHFNNTNNWRQQFEVLDLSFSTQNTRIDITTWPSMHRHYTGFEEISTLTILRVEKEMVKQWRATGNVTIDAKISGQYIIPTGKVTFVSDVTLEMSCDKSGQCEQNRVRHNDYAAFMICPLSLFVFLLKIINKFTIQCLLHLPNTESLIQLVSMESGTNITESSNLVTQ